MTKTYSSNNRAIISQKPTYVVNPEDKSIRKGKTVWCLTDNSFYKSAREASRETRIPYSSVINNLNGRCKQTYGKKFIYADVAHHHINDIGAYILELKANAETKAEQVRLAEERAARAEAETQRFKDIWHSVQNTVDEAFTG